MYDLRSLMAVWESLLWLSKDEPALVVRERRRLRTEGGDFGITLDI